MTSFIFLAARKMDDVTYKLPTNQPQFTIVLPITGISCNNKRGSSSSDTLILIQASFQIQYTREPSTVY